MILGGMIFAVYVLIVIQREVRSLQLMLQTGVEEGVPVSIEYRRFVLWGSYVPAGMYAVALTTVGVFAMIQIGTNVADLKVRTLAYLCAGGAGISAIFWALGVLNGILYSMSELRKASMN